MKKLYTLVTSASLALVATAATPVLDASQNRASELRPAQAFVHDAEISHTRVARASSAITLASEIQPSQTSSLVKAPSAEDYDFIGEATYTDAILYTAYNGATPTYKVNAYAQKVAADATPKKYVFSDIYSQDVLKSFGYGFYDIIDPNAESTLTLTLDSQNRVLATFSFNVTDGDVLTAPQRLYGSFANGTFSFPEQAFTITYSGVAYAYSPAFDVRLPGAKDLDIKLTAESTLCNEDNVMAFSVAGGADVATLKVFVVNGRYGVSDSNLKVVAANGEVVKAGTYSLPASDEWNTVFAVALDADGNIGKGAALYFYGTNHYPDQWTSLGQVAFTDDTFAPVYGVKDAIPAYNVELLESNDTPGLFRLVNPYAKHPLASNYDNHPDHNHYVTIDATDPAKVQIPLAPMGIEFKDGLWSLASVANGTFADGAITFPIKGLVIYDETLSGYYANQYARFNVPVPGNLTVTVADENGAPLEGVTVAVKDSEATVTTDATGVAHLGVPAGATTFTASKEGYTAVEFTPQASGRYFTATVTLKAESSGIDDIEAANPTVTKAFNLKGIRVDSNASGIVIINGKKTYQTK